MRRIHVAMAGTLMHPLYDYGCERFDRVTDRSIQEQLSPMLHADEQPTAAGLKEAAWKIAAPLVELDDAEREYIERVHAGDLRPELLFPDDAALVEQLTQHPALRWKIENVKKHRST